MELTEHVFRRVYGEGFLEGMAALLTALDPPESKRMPDMYAGPVPDEMREWMARSQAQLDQLTMQHKARYPGEITFER